MHPEKKHILNHDPDQHGDPDNLLFAYQGPFFIDTLTTMGHHLKNLTSHNMPLQKKLFRVYVELTQNVSNYAEQCIPAEKKQKRIGIGEVGVKEDKNLYYLTTKNLVHRQDANILSQRCEIINSADLTHLKNLKRELRKSSTDHKLGARIGLVQARLISSNQLHYSILHQNREYSYFKLTVKFSKNGEH